MRFVITQCTNPSGARPTVFDASRNIYGVDRATGFALRPFDNAGVQYGLKALNEGVISTTQFLDLNERIGGVRSGRELLLRRARWATSGRSRRAYQAGVHPGGGGGLALTPVSDTSGSV